MTTKPTNRYRAFMVAQTLDHLDFHTAVKIAKTTGAQYSVIIHDRDIGTEHLHITLEYENAKTIASVAKALKIPQNFIQKWDKRTYNMYAYLLHHTKDAKSTKVDYTSYLEDPNKFSTNIDNYIERGQAPHATGVRGHVIDTTIQEILQGTLTRKELLQPDKLPLYYKYMTKIDKAIKLRTESLKYNPPNNTTTYIYGATGLGKSSKALEIAQTLYPNSFTIASSSNDLLQDYTGEKCLIIDDFRPEDFPFIELLALLDPYHRQRTHRSRYYNKPLATELIILTSIHSLDDVLQHYHYANPNEDMRQLRRRIQTINHLHDTEMTAITYDEQNDAYSLSI